MKKALIVVTIPTHLRVLMQIADLLKRSGEYEPIMVYSPDAVFRQNVENCQSSPHDVFLWTGISFVDRQSWHNGSWRIKKPLSIGQAYIKKTISSLKKARRLVRIVLRKALGNELFYKLTDKKHTPKGRGVRLRKIFPFLPEHLWILCVIKIINKRITAFVWSLIYGCAYGISILRALFALAKNRTSPIGNWRNLYKKMKGHRFLARNILVIFSQEWLRDSNQAITDNKGILGYITKLFREGLFHGIGEHKLFLKAFDKLVNETSPDLIILPEENLFYNSHLISSVAKSHNIACSVVPFTIVNTLEWAEAFWDVPIYRVKGCWNRLMALAFPEWVLKHKGRKLILLPSLILSAEYLGVRPDTPWLINSGQAESIAVESQFMMEYYLRAGIRKSKLYLTGSVNDDVLYNLLTSRELYKKELFLKYGIPPKDKVILIALPPNQFGGGIRDGCEFDEYDSMIDFIVSSAVDNCWKDAAIIVNLHPRIDIADVRCIEKYGVKIVDEPVERVIPLADLYVAVVSATIRTAMACGIPVINYDSYNYNYDDYNNLHSVLEVNSKAAYGESLRRIATDKAFYSDLKKEQENLARRQYCIDGKSSARILEMFNQLTENKLPVKICTLEKTA